MALIYEDPMRTSMLRLFRDSKEAVRIQVYRFVKQSGDRHFLRETLTRAKDSQFSRRSDEEQWEVIQTLSAHGQLPVINLFFCDVASSGSVWANEHLRKIQYEAIQILTRFPTIDGQHVLKKLSRRLIGAKDLREAAQRSLAQLDAQSKKSSKGSDEGDA